jgi:ElaB/YqjD/DUF883 family membrane-anchored ribosome-binding protein
MNSINETGNSPIDNGRIRKTDPRGSTPKGEAIAGQEVHDLMADVQNLLGQLAHVADPEIARLRGKVAGALAQAQRVVSDGAEQVQRHARRVIHVGDDYVRDRPWQSIGVAAAAGIVVGFLVARR